MAKNQSQETKLKNVEVTTSYYANGNLYAIVEKEDTVRFYKMVEEKTLQGDDMVRWVATDIYLKAPIAVIGID